MPDETVDRDYKESFNIAYALTQSPKTAAVVERLIKQEQDPEHRRALEAGRKEHEAEAERHYHEHLRDEYAAEGQRMSKGQDRDAEILKRYYAEMGPLPTEEQDAILIASILDKQQEKEPFKGSDRVGKGPPLSEDQKKEHRDFEHQQRSRDIANEAKKAADPQRQAYERMKAAQEQRDRDRDKDRGRD